MKLCAIETVFSAWQQSLKRKWLWTLAAAKKVSSKKGLAAKLETGETQPSLAGEKLQHGYGAALCENAGKHGYCALKAAAASYRRLSGLWQPSGENRSRKYQLYIYLALSQIFSGSCWARRQTKDRTYRRQIEKKGDGQRRGRAASRLAQHGGAQAPAAKAALNRGRRNRAYLAAAAPPLISAASGISGQRSACARHRKLALKRMAPWLEKRHQQLEKYHRNKRRDGSSRTGQRTYEKSKYGSLGESGGVIEKESEAVSNDGASSKRNENGENGGERRSISEMKRNNGEIAGRHLAKK